jgi:hypothetical protein
VLVPVLVVAAAAGIIVAAASGGSKPLASPRPAATVPPPTDTTVTKGGKWLGGSDTKLLAAVNTDLGKVLAAEEAGRQGAARAAGSRLATAASTALGGPMPPVDAAAYRTAMKDLETVGDDAASGKYADATHLLTVGELNLMKVTAAADAPVPQKTPAIPEPND